MIILIYKLCVERLASNELQRLSSLCHMNLCIQKISNNDIKKDSLVTLSISVQL